MLNFCSMHDILTSERWYINVKKENTAIRLKKLMEARNLRQVDILNLASPYCKKYGVKMNKSDLSQYCSGKTEPNQDKLFILGAALNVNEAWLMGFDVPMERNAYEDKNILKFDAELDDIQKILETDGFTMSFSDDFYDDIVIKYGDTFITCMHDYELVNKYESLSRKNISITASALLDNLNSYSNNDEPVDAFDFQLKALGWTYKIIYLEAPLTSYVIFKNKDISFNVSIGDYNKFVADAESFYKDRLQNLLMKSTQNLFLNTRKDSKEVIGNQPLQQNNKINKITPLPFNNVTDARDFLATHQFSAALKDKGKLSDQTIIDVANAIKTNEDN